MRQFWLAVMVATTTMACEAASSGGVAIAEDTTSDTQLADSAADTIGDSAATDVSATEVTADAEPDATTVGWTVFSLSTGGFCPTDCTKTWTVSPDGTLAMKKSGVTSSGKLSSTDLSALQAILDAASFLAKMKDGFTCEPPPTDISYAFSYALFGVAYDKDVTGCQISGGADSGLVKAVTKILMAY
jgi:hypothetical protein